MSDIFARATELLNREDVSASELTRLLKDIQEEGREELTQKTDLIKKINRRLDHLITAFKEDPFTPVLATTKPEKSGLYVLPTREKKKGLGDVNLALTPVPLGAEPYAQVIIELIRELVVQTGGLMPTSLFQEYILTNNGQKEQLRVDWQFTRALGDDDLRALYQLVAASYSEQISGLKSSGKGWSTTGPFWKFDGKAESNLRGVFLGADKFFGAASNGLFVGRFFKTVASAQYHAREMPYDWVSTKYAQTKKERLGHIVLRDDGWTRNPNGNLMRSKSLSQEKFIWLCVQVSYVLKHKKFLDRQALYAEIFWRLNQIGTKRLEKDRLFGFEPIVEEITRVMLLPALYPDRCDAQRVQAESVMMAGLPGVGKTYIERYLMYEHREVLFLAVDSLRLRMELEKENHDATGSDFLLRAEEIRQLTGLTVILVIDDFDTVATKELTPKFLNLMEGIRESGFLILASTNYPYDIDTRLLEPKRISHLIHVKRQGEKGRRGVLGVHLADRGLTPQHIENIIDWATPKTEGWTHRYLEELANVAAQLAVINGDPVFSIEHIKQAHTHLEPKLRLNDLDKWDERIAASVSSHNRRHIGY